MEGKGELKIEQRCNSIILYYSPTFWFLVVHKESAGFAERPGNGRTTPSLSVSITNNS